eukprot:TRINITY_DN1877_c0_g1_i1.p1 TRINITY_DN1877_c0_g1~~TRINITY_DN1877_c0_g1_i1.p1  ORF type:complete len:212 (-),score=96.12 TRINITY_DN1877_c0_g1_i1:101-694(-)
MAEDVERIKKMIGDNLNNENATKLVKDVMNICWRVDLSNLTVQYSTLLKEQAEKEMEHKGEEDELPRIQVNIGLLDRAERLYQEYLIKENEKEDQWQRERDGEKEKEKERVKEAEKQKEKELKKQKEDDIILSENEHLKATLDRMMKRMEEMEEEQQKAFARSKKKTEVMEKESADLKAFCEKLKRENDLLRRQIKK